MLLAAEKGPWRSLSIYNIIACNSKWVAAGEYGD